MVTHSDVGHGNSGFHIVDDFICREEQQSVGVALEGLDDLESPL